MRICSTCSSTFGDEVVNCPDDGAVLLIPDDPMVGTTIGKYVVVRRLGRGGMGSVFLGLHPIIKSRVAIKVLNASAEDKPDQFERFVMEAQSVNEIRHANIINIIDLDVLDDGRPYILMEYLEGVTLRERMEQQPLDIDSTRSTVVQILDALEAAHNAGFVHRDLKPENVWITRSGQVKLLDFGIAKMTARDATAITQTGEILGTPMYLSPEQARGAISQIGPATDLYALGVMLFELYTGRPPFKFDNVFELVLAHIQTPPRRPSSLNQSVTPKLESVILSCLAKEPSERPASVSALRTSFIEGHDEFARGASRPLVSPVSQSQTENRSPIRRAHEDRLGNQPTIGSEATLGDERTLHQSTAKELTDSPTSPPRGVSFERPPAEAPPSEQPKGTVIVLQSAHTGTVDPVLADHRRDFALLSHTHEPLLRIDTLTGEFTPWLALSWELRERSIVFTLRRDVHFHDRTPLLAPEVADSLRRHLESGQGGLWDLKRVEVLDDHRLELWVDNPSRSFLARLSLRKIAKPSSPFPVGSGPYEVRSMNPAGGTVILSSISNYWGERPKIDKIVFKSVHDRSARMSLLRQGRAHLTVEYRTDGLPGRDDDPEIRMVRTADNGCTYLHLNTQQPYLSDPRVRQAIAQAVDVDHLVSDLYKKQVTAATGFLPPGLLSSRSGVRPYRFDPSRSAERTSGTELASRTLRLLLYSDEAPFLPEPEIAARIIVDGFAKAGLEVEPVFLPRGECLEACAAGDHDMCFIGVGVDYPDPESILNLFSRAGLEAGMNFSRFVDDDFERLLDCVKTELDPMTRSRQVSQLERLLIAAAPAVPIANAAATVIMRSELKDVQIDIEQIEAAEFSLTNAYLDE